MKNKIICTLLFVLSSTSHALNVENTKVTRLFIQSQSDSNAHAVKVDKAIDPVCESRLYIEFEDKALFSSLLAYKLADKEFNLMYEVLSSGKIVKGHLAAKCHLFSIY